MSRRFSKAGKVLVWSGGVLTVIVIGMLMQVYRHGVVEDIERVDAIVVLGAAQWNGSPSPVFKSRLDRANELYKEGYAPFIIVTGGKGGHADVSDSSIGKEYLLENGVGGADVFIEEQSRTTLQNIMYAQEILREHDARSILLVSNDFHMMRAKNIARDLGFAVYAVPVETKDTLQEFGYSLREVVVYGAYLLFRI